LDQENQLNSYGWVDEQAGTAHIPIDHAMDLIVERGLPVRPASETETNSAGTAKTPVSKQSASELQPK